ncbi:MAG: hypothetical protein P8017_05790 [Deltaproteobacteria bacterium]
MKTPSRAYPRVINIVGAGNVGVWTAYRLTKLYEAHGLEIPEIHLFDKNPQAAMQISAQIGAHLQADETLHDFEHELHRLNLLLTYKDGGRMLGSSQTALEKRLEEFGNQTDPNWYPEYAALARGDG